MTLVNRNGLHARPAHMFVQTANSYASKLRVGRTDNDERVDGKSSREMMRLAAERGEERERSAEGHDAEPILRARAEVGAANVGEE